MKRFSLILASLVLVFGAKASAFTGGPFDNGDYNTLLDDSGIYQVSFRLSNGSGFAQFGNNVDTELFLPTTAGGAATAPASTYSVLNRSIIYYKGITYLGTCTGMVDHDAKIVAGVTNGNSDISTSATTAAGGTTSTSTNNLVFSGVGFPCNTEFRCKITKTQPILRFSGTGELTIVNPSVANVTLQALTEIITGGGGVGNIGTQITNLITAVTGANAALIAGAIPSAEQTFQNSEHAKMTVFGSRIFFNSRR